MDQNKAIRIVAKSGQLVAMMNVVVCLAVEVGIGKEEFLKDIGDAFEQQAEVLAVAAAAALAISQNETVTNTDKDRQPS